MEKKKDKKELDEDEVEKILDITWKNWESRRKCEQTHIPEYSKENNKEERE